jgi:hypothetical protein
MRYRKNRRKRGDSAVSGYASDDSKARNRLTFAELSNRIDEAFVDEPDSDRRWLWGASIGVAVLPMTLLIAGWLSVGTARAVLVFGAVILQWSVLLVFLAQGVFKLRSSYRTAHWDYARELDRAFAIHGGILRWLRTFPERERSEFAGFALARKETLARRLGWVTGGLDKLGVLPLLGVAYLQLKDANVENLLTLERSDFTSAVMLALLAFVYAGFWWLIRLLNRLELYCELLDRSLAAGERVLGGSAAETGGSEAREKRAGPRGAVEMGRPL